MALLALLAPSAVVCGAGHAGTLLKAIELDSAIAPERDVIALLCDRHRRRPRHQAWRRCSRNSMAISDAAPLFATRPPGEWCGRRADRVAALEPSRTCRSASCGAQAALRHCRRAHARELARHDPRVRHRLTRRRARLRHAVELVVRRRRRALSHDTAAWETRCRRGFSEALAGLHDASSN